jgi:hypothetical protein
MATVMKKIAVYPENKTVDITISLSFILPKTINTNEVSPKQSRLGYASDVIGAWQRFLISAIEFRQKACLKNLLKNEDNIVFNDGFSIKYKTADNAVGYFNIPSYQTMEDAIRELKCNNYITFAKNKMMVEQTIKALCESHPADKTCCGFTYTNLISVLMMCFSIEEL